MNDERQRLDRWLFFARLVKSRTLAQKLVESGAVRINSERTRSPDRRIGLGDVLTLALGGRILVLRVAACGTRRGPASEARALYDDLSPDRDASGGPYGPTGTP